MGLRIDVYKRDISTREKVYMHLEPSKATCGLDSYRKDFWGAEVMRSLGLTVLPILRDGQKVIAERQWLDDLEHELHIIADNIAVVQERTGIAEQDIYQYLNNILEAVHMAREMRGGVQIW